MRLFRRFLLSLILLAMLLSALLYVALNSSYVFDKAAAYFGPKYNLWYESISGNAWNGITLTGLYYKEKKLAREIKIKLNPVTLLEKRITVSHLTLHGVNESYLEFMLADLSSPEEKSGSTAFPFSISVKNVMLTLLPFEISGIRFRQADLRVASIDYAEDAFAFGTLKFMAKTSLGHADIQGRYHDGNLQLSELSIGNLNTDEIEKLFFTGKKEQRETGEVRKKPSIFIPKILSVAHLKMTVLPRKYKGLFLSLLTLEGREVEVDLGQRQWSGDLNLSLVTDIAKAETSLHATVDQLAFKEILIKDINLSKIMTWISRDENRSSEGGQSMATEDEGKHADRNLSTSFVPSLMRIDQLQADLLPTVYAGIAVRELALHSSGFVIDLPKQMLKEGNITLHAESDMATLIHHGRITNNRLTSHSEVTLQDQLIDSYRLPLRKGAIRSVLLDGVTDRNGTQMQLSFSAKQLLKSAQDGFNLDIDHAVLSTEYHFDTSLLKGTLEANLSTPYTEGAMLGMRFVRKDGVQYTGALQTKRIKAIDSRLSALLKRVSVAFDGNLSALHARIDSHTFQGDFHSKDLQKGIVHLESKRDIAVSGIIKLPEALRQASVGLSADLPIDLHQPLPLHTKVKLLSNVTNIDGEILYGESLKLKADAVIPPKTLLKGFDPDIKFSALSPMQITAELTGEKLHATLHAQKLKLKGTYALKSGLAKGDIDLAGTHLAVEGTAPKEIVVKLNSRSIQSLRKAVNSIYPVELPDLHGNITLETKINDLKSATVTLHSKEIMIGRDAKTGTKLSNLSLRTKADSSKVILERYTLETEGIKLFATKPSAIHFKGGSIVVDPLWVNDALKSTGSYDLTHKKGTLNAQASSLKISHTLADITTALGIKTRINGEKIAVEGKVHLKGGKIKYDLNQKHFAADSDIVILQKQRKKSNGFEKNVQIHVTLDSSKPLRYKMKNIDISLMPDLIVKKRYGGTVKVNGKVILSPGGYYLFEGKRFVLQKSSIHFKGKPTAPILNINIVYKHADTTIRVKVSGTASDPVLHFSSDPQMSREEILSYILFDTDSGGKNNKAGDVTNLVAGTLVKSLFANMGLKLDHLVLTGAGFEVGKKISDRITVIYNQEEKSSVKIRIENSRHIETDISFGTNSRSADIFYKREF